MVWHAFLLNPGDYKRYCYQSKLKHLYRVSFPWDRIVSISPVNGTAQSYDFLA